MRARPTLIATSGVVFASIVGGAFALAACTEATTAVQPTTDATPALSDDAGGGDAGELPSADAAVEEPAAPSGPSCVPGGGAGTVNDCGDETSCCASAPLPGGTFHRWKNGANPAPQDEHPATVSAFTLDLFEVTVGRFRRFVDAGGGTRLKPPEQGVGAHPRIPGSGWKSAWNVLLAGDRGALDGALLHDGTPVTLWTQGPGPNETKPMKGLGYALAFAFCAWDGGRLPTLAEWNFAAMGGDEHRTFPWGDAIGKTRAVYDCRDEGSDVGCDPVDIPSVGSKPKGMGRWGHFDLAGSVKEWALDSDPDLMPCHDCGVVDPTGNWTVLLGGSFWSPEIREVTSTSIVLKSTPAGDFESGVRCARDRAPK